MFRQYVIAVAFYWASPIGIALALVLAFPQDSAKAQAGQSGYSGDTVVLQGGNGEYFVGGLPRGWREIPVDGNNSTLERRWVPADQDPSRFSDAIVFQTLPFQAGVSTESFFREFARSYTERCPDLLSTEFKAAEFPNGFDDISVILACPQNNVTAIGEVTLFRAIGGAGSFYLIQRGWQLPPFPPERIPLSGKQFDAATKAVEFGYACEVGNQSRPCPAGWDPVLAGLDKSNPTVVFPAGK